MAHRNRPPQKCLPRPALLAAGLLSLGGFPQCSRGQAPTDKLSTELAGATSREDAIHKGLLFSAVAPVPEDALKRLDGTPNEQSFTVPLTVDRANNRLYVEAKINSKSVRLILDTGGGPMIGLDDATAKGIELTDKAGITVSGPSGNAAETGGLARSMTIGNLTLRQVLVTVSHKLPYYSSTLGMQALTKYRITLDFAARTMTLTRGGVLTLPKGGSTLSLPFDYAGGYIFVPVHVLDQDGWAFLDSGSCDTIVSLKAAKTSALRLSASDAESVAIDKQIGLGDTEKKITVLTLKVPIPISLDAGHDSTQFSITSLGGASAIDDALNNQFSAGGSINALLGFPFFVQFQRVIIDYPNRTLVLQYPVKDTPLKVAGLTATHDRAWPGYKWTQKGYAWIEVPDDKTPAPPLAATTASGETVVTTTGGSVTVTTNGVTKVYSLPPGSGVTVNPDDSVHISPAAGGTTAAGQSGGT